MSMRYKMRSTRAIVLLVCTFLLICFYTSSRLANRDFPTFTTDESLIPVHDISTFWAHWSTIIYKTRPLTQHIILTSNAKEEGVSATDNSTRSPPANHVANPSSDIDSLAASHSAFLSHLKSEVMTPNVFNGTGIVTVGGGQYFGPAILSLRMLRNTGSNLPVEIFLADKTEYEKAICEEYLPKYNAKCLIISDFLAQGHKLPATHYQLKALAMMFSSFEEILYLDSDSMPIMDPAKELFATEPYKSNGLVIWPDFWVASESPLFYTIAGMPSFPTGLAKSSSEAGQVMFNKKTHLKSLLLSVYYNIYGPDYYYPLLSQGVVGQGDKETFMAAAIVLGESYYRVTKPVHAQGRWDGGVFKGCGMVQYHAGDDYQLTLPQISHPTSSQSSTTSSQKEISGATSTPDTTVSPSSSSNSTILVAPPRAFFMHANFPKINAGHLLKINELIGKDGKHLRMWGNKEDQIKTYGEDLEKRVWEMVVVTGCELADVLRDWKKTENMCGKLKAHWKEVFAS